MVRTYTVEGTTQQVVGQYSHTVRVRRGDRRAAIIDMAEDRYLASPPDVLYKVAWAEDQWVPRLRSGDTMVWSFAISFTEAVTDYQEKIAVRRTSCAG